VEQLGEGGFGVVFLAEQQRPVGRKVALKVLKPGMDTRQGKLAPHDRDCLDAALEGLVELYDAWGRPDEAAKWRKELEKTKAKA
jgi:serine/threonine protein kinase